jgi:hypothetical protein
MPPRPRLPPHHKSVEHRTPLKNPRIRAWPDGSRYDAFIGWGWRGGAIAAGCTPVLGIDSDSAPLKLSGPLQNCEVHGKGKLKPESLFTLVATSIHSTSTVKCPPSFG